MFKENTTLLRISVSSVLGTVGGLVSGFLGGVDQLMITLITVICLDYLTGVIRAIYEKKLSSSVGFKGILKKVLILLVVALTVSLEKIMPSAFPLREITIFFFVANEGFSILENAAGFIPLPEKIRSVLAQLQDKSYSKTKDDDDTPPQEQKDPQNPQK